MFSSQQYPLLPLEQIAWVISPPTSLPLTFSKSSLILGPTRFTPKRNPHCPPLLEYQSPLGKEKIYRSPWPLKWYSQASPSCPVSPRLSGVVGFSLRLVDWLGFSQGGWLHLVQMFFSHCFCCLGVCQWLSRKLMQRHFSFFLIWFWDSALQSPVWSKVAVLNYSVWVLCYRGVIIAQFMHDLDWKFALGVHWVPFVFFLL